MEIALHRKQGKQDTQKGSNLNVKSRLTSFILRKMLVLKKMLNKGI